MKKIILNMALILLVGAIVFMLVFAQTSAQKVASIVIIIAMLFTAAAMAKAVYSKPKRK